MRRRYGLLIASLSLLVLLGGCESKNIENEAKRKEKERLEQQEEAEKQKKQEEERKAEEKRRQELQSITGIYHGFLTQNGKRENESLELVWRKGWGDKWELAINAATPSPRYRFNALKLTSEEKDKWVFYTQDTYNRKTVTCYYTPSKKSIRVTCIDGNWATYFSDWEFEGTRQ